MQKIEGLLKPKGVSVTKQEFLFCVKQMKILGVKKFSTYIRGLVAKEMQKEQQDAVDIKSKDLMELQDLLKKKISSNVAIDNGFLIVGFSNFHIQVSISISDTISYSVFKIASGAVTCAKTGLESHKDVVIAIEDLVNKTIAQSFFNAG